MSEFKGPSGAVIVINIAPWKDAKALKRAVQKEAAESGLADINFNMDVTKLLAVLLKVDSAESVDAALWPCLARCTRDGHKITETTFDDEKSRLDYYDIILECGKVNFRPLVESLLSKLPEAFRQITKANKA